MILIELLILTWIGCVLAVLLASALNVWLVMTNGVEDWLTRVLGSLLLGCVCVTFMLALKLTGLEQQPAPLAYVLAAATTLAAVSLVDLKLREDREVSANDVDATFDRPRFTRRTIS